MENNLGNKETMAKNIKRYMNLKGVTAKEMCKVLNVPESTFSYWLNAKTYPRIDKIEKMSNYFGISKIDLIEEPIKDKLIRDLQFFSEKEKPAIVDELKKMSDREITDLFMQLISGKDKQFLQDLAYQILVLANSR